MKEGKLWSELSEEEWKEERARVRKVQDRHFHEGERNGRLDEKADRSI